MSQKLFYPFNKKQNHNLKQMNLMQPNNQIIINPTKSKIIPNTKNIQQNHQQQTQQHNSQQNNTKSPLICCQPQQIKNYLYSWLFFIISFIIYLLIWVIGHFTIQRLTSYYYFNSYNISPYTSINAWALSMRANNGSTQTYIQSNQLYNQDDLKKADSIALSLFFSWIMWKLPLTVFTLKIIRHKSHSLQRYSTYGFFLVLLLLIDIMVTIFKPDGYEDWVFFIIYIVLSIILIIINGLRSKKKILKNFKNFILPMCYIVITYVCFSLLIPGIYGAIYKGLGNDAAYIIVYIFPVIDLFFYSLIILQTYLCQSHTIKFIKMFHFLNTGYLVGHIILFSPQDVEFYFLVGYLMLRNLSFNWIIQKVQKYVIIPGPIPGWIMIFLVSLCINFLPWIGFGKLVVSSSFYSQFLQLTLPIQSYILQNDYYAYNSVKLPTVQTFNPGLNSNIQISSVFIIWVLLLITQKYHISKVQFKEIFVYVFGIYMFYFGLATGSQLYYLQSNSL